MKAKILVVKGNYTDDAAVADVITYAAESLFAAYDEIAANDAILSNIPTSNGRLFLNVHVRQTIDSLNLLKTITPADSLAGAICIITFVIVIHTCSAALNKFEDNGLRGQCPALYPY